MPAAGSGPASGDAPQRTALLIMDVQRATVEYAAADPGLTGRLARAAAAARSVGLTVIHVVVRFRPGHPEVSPRNRGFMGLKGSGRFVEGDPAIEIHPDLEPQPGDVVVVKRRVSAFAGSDLDVLLRAGGCDALVLGGIATSGVVLSTVRAAADMDFRLTVLADGCADPDPEVHRVLLDKVFPRQAEVLSVDDWVRRLGPPA